IRSRTEFPHLLRHVGRAAGRVLQADPALRRFAALIFEAVNSTAPEKSGAVFLCPHRRIAPSLSALLSFSHHVTMEPCSSATAGKPAAARLKLERRSAVWTTELERDVPGRNALPSWARLKAARARFSMQFCCEPGGNR